MNVLVVGGSGFIGTKLSNTLIDHGHSVTVLSRSPEEDELNPAINFARGDVTEYNSIKSAFDGQDVVVNLVALSPLFKPGGGDEMHSQVHLGGTKNVIQAAETKGVNKLVQMSALGADPAGATAYIRAKGQAERAVQDSALNWVIIRPSVIFGDGGEFVTFTKMLTTPYITGLPGGGKTRFRPLWVGDLVPLLVTTIEQDGYSGKIYELGGPEVLTLADVTRLVYQAAGKPVVILPVPMIFAGLGLTIADILPGIPMGRDQYRSLKFDNTPEHNQIDAFGVNPNDLCSLSEHLTATGDTS